MLAKLKLNDRILKNIINFTFLTLSSFLILYFLIQLTDNPYIKVGFSLFTIILEVFMQYLLSTGRAKWKLNIKFQAVIMFSCYGLYVLVYAIPSATGFFMAEINTQEQMSARKEIVEDTSKQRLIQINSTINNLNAQLATESKSGYGKKSRMIMDEMKQLTAEQADIQNHFQNTAIIKTAGPKDLFKILGDVFNIPGNILKVIIFGISVLMVYVGLIMTNWDIEINRDSGTCENTITETPDPETGTSFETLETPKWEKKICPACGKHFPLNHEKTAHRNKSPIKGAC